MSKKDSGDLLNFAWNYRLKLRAESRRLWEEGNELFKISLQPVQRAIVGRLEDEDRAKHNLKAESDRLTDESDRLMTESEKLWAEAIVAKFGNIEVKWLNWNEGEQGYECHLENGEIYGFEK